jgi:uncharacterized protein (TIGR02246 family)
MSDTPEFVARAFIGAINHQNVEELATLMTPDHRFIDSLGNVVEGREKMRAGWKAYFKMIPDYQIVVDTIFCKDQIVVLLGVAEGTYAEAGELKPENRWSTPVALRADITNGAVGEWRVYADNEPLRALMRNG